MPPTSAFILRPATVIAASNRFFNSPASLSSPSFQQYNVQYVFYLEQRQHFSFLLKSCSSTTHFFQLHTQFIRNLFFNNPNFSLNFLSQASLVFPHKISHIRRIFDQIPKPGTYHYNVMIRVLSRSEVSDDGVVLFKVMRKEGVVSDALTLSFCLKCCAKRLGLIEGMQIHRRILGDGHVRDCILMTSLIELYSVCGKTEDACKVFDEMPVRDTVAYNALISCFLNNKRTRDTLAVFDSMLSLGTECRPDAVTCLLLLQACAHLGAVDFGERVRDYVEKHGYGEYMNLNNTLITMYSNCGVVDEAYRIFESMPVKNCVSWTTMISGFGMNGYGKDAVKLFREMLDTGIAPDDKAMTAVLYACSHSGLLNEGFDLFENMSKEFGIQPNTHHYGCAVDILGRLGLLEKAYDLILSMPVKPDAKIWRTLLAACRTYKAFHLAEHVVERIVELKAQEAGDYILLLNTYSSNRKWDKVIELRKFMRENKIMTTPGCSTIEMKGVVHKFIADDISHPQKDEIYETIHEILQQLRIAGYVPQISSEMHDMEATEKENALCYHSEKLAIAFGVLSTPPGTTIRVANSVRICVDCHDFAKVFSAAYDRKVIIRDRNRIHIFRKGGCSCSDCW
ncbi:hypothetical protein RND81_13G117200 [Saponaria officinalis]|uniref:DYW domain-containing protein n=1 Tax=Saponaria officinalis TaxID=3572 RepID=A0AAW1GWS0_SAPOF